MDTYIYLQEGCFFMSTRGNGVSIPIEGMYTASEAANLAGVSRQRLETLRRKGQEPHFYVKENEKRNRIYYPKASFDKWLEKYLQKKNKRQRVSLEK